MKFTDYPKDLQRIVELTPEGWEQGAYCVWFLDGPDRDSDKAIFEHYECYLGEDWEFLSTEYEQCRAAWLAEMAEENELPVDFCADAVAAMNEPVEPYVRRGDRVDWRGIIEQAFMAGQASCGVDPSFSEAQNHARKALEQTK